MKLNTKYFTDQKITNMKFGTKSPGLGDTLLLTSVCKYFPNQFTIQLDENKSRFSCLFSGLANVELVKNEEINELEDIGSGHYATRKLRNFFGEAAEGMDNRPLVLYSDSESEKWAFSFLKNITNPVIFNPCCSKHHAHSRNIPDDLITNILSDLAKNNYTPIICQSSLNQKKIDGFNVTDLDLKKYISLIRRCKIYIGANTGDEHLCVALGCKTIVYQPAEDPVFKASEWNYNHPNSNYIGWET